MSFIAWMQPITDALIGMKKRTAGAIRKRMVQFPGTKDSAVGVLLGVLVGLGVWVGLGVGVGLLP